MMTTHRNSGPGVPDGHPLQKTFAALTARGLEQARIGDELSVRYISNMLMGFLRTDDLYRLRGESRRPLGQISDMLVAAEQAATPLERQNAHRHLGDFTLFMLGLYPECMDRPRRALTARDYADFGSRSYRIVADLAQRGEPGIYHRLSFCFDAYVDGLRWVKRYTADPFYQYMLREFQVS
jgi:hypothetical protein